MKSLKCMGRSAVCLGLLVAGCAALQAQVAVSIGAEPVCPYGYYEAPPYTCAPDGYYGPWFHGPANFYGHVDHGFDYRKGYKGPTPSREDRPAENRAQFHGQAMHDARGREAPKNRK